MDAQTDPARPQGQRPASPALATWRRFRRNRLGVFGMVVLVLLLAASLFGPTWMDFTYEQQDLLLGAAPPGSRSPTASTPAEAPVHWLGTDVLGRDLLTRVLYGGRVSLLVGVCATAVSLLIGVTYGAVSGYAGARTDTIMMRIVDVLYAIPFSVFVIVLMVVFGRRFLLLFVAIGAVEWLTMARIVRGQVLSVKQQMFVRAARVLGYSPFRIVFRHILPNVLGPIVVYATLTVPRVMLMEAFLSFLGLGVQPPMSSWGLLIRDGAEVMESYVWLMIVPGAALSLTLFSLNFIGDALRDALDPRFMSTST